MHKLAASTVEHSGCWSGGRCLLPAQVSIDAVRGTSRRRCEQTKAMQQLAVFQQALQEIEEDEAAGLEQQLASLRYTQACSQHLSSHLSHAA